jgi:hypothetical protein
MNLRKIESVRSTKNLGIPTVSFSGIDGAGKSTQIDRLRSDLEQRGIRVCILRFWDDIAAMTQLRDEAGRRVFKGEKGIGTPEAPVNRRDKNVRGWPITCLRLVIYFLDALSLRRAYRRAIQSGADFIIFDRYIYDELANLDLDRRTMSAYARIILRLVPEPGVSFFLDADPERARARKPEYPVEFLWFNRNAYLNLACMHDLAIIPPGAIETVHVEVLAKSFSLLGEASTAPMASLARNQASPAAKAQNSPPVPF